MNLLAYLFRFYYSSETKSSKNQLQEDFGAFPPAPLLCEGLVGNFEVIRTRGIGEVWQTIRMLKELLHPSSPELQELSPDAAAFMGDSIPQVHAAVERFSGGSLTKRRVLTSVMLGLGFIVESWRFARHGPRRGTALGIFMPMRKNESEIVIQVSRHKKSKLNDAATITHEHIHLLQHKHADLHSRTIKRPELLLTEPPRFSWRPVGLSQTATMEV